MIDALMLLQFWKAGYDGVGYPHYNPWQEYREAYKLGRDKANKDVLERCSKTPRRHYRPRKGKARRAD